MKWIRVLWHSCVDAYFFGLKEECTWINGAVFRDDDKHLMPESKWYFWDEHEIEILGPFDSYRICIKELKRYCDCLDEEGRCPRCSCLESGCWEVGCLSDGWEDEYVHIPIDDNSYRLEA